MRQFAALSVVLVCAQLGASAQAPAASSKTSVSVTGCLAPAQRDGSLAAKATAPAATPDTAAMEANNPVPTGAYMLQDASVVGDAPTATRATYALRGQTQELAKHNGHQVEITGMLLAPIGSKLPSKSAAVAEGIRPLEVSSVKMIAAKCPATKK